MDYSTRADTSFFRGGTEAPYYFGVELEVVATKNVLNAAVAIKKWWGGDAICKKDGSLGENGIEICTSPGTLAWHREKWLKFLGMDWAGKISAWSVPTCGLHVHFSRTAMNCFSLSKFMVFVNNPQNQRFIEEMAGRTANHYSQIVKKRMCDLSTGHYDCVNTANRDTIEVRIFKSTLNARRVLMNLDFVDALIAFSNDGLFSVQDSMSRDVFKEFLMVNRERWPYLASRMEYGIPWLKGVVTDGINVGTKSSETD
jgi:hypothetical protein